MPATPFQQFGTAAIFASLPTIAGYLITKDTKKRITEWIELKDGNGVVVTDAAGNKGYEITFTAYILPGTVEWDTATPVAYDGANYLVKEQSLERDNGAFKTVSCTLFNRDSYAVVIPTP
jgi:hypothetical protein